MTTTAGHSFYIWSIGSFYYQVNDTGSWELLVYLCSPWSWVQNVFLLHWLLNFSPYFCQKSPKDSPYFVLKNFALKSPYFSQNLAWKPVMVFNATFNNISVISWQSNLLVVETGLPAKTTANYWQISSNNIVSSTPHRQRDSTS